MIVARLFKKENCWKIVSILNEHNHESNPDLIGHSIARQMNSEEKAAVHRLASVGAGAAEAVNMLQNEYNNTYTSKRDIYNEFAAVRQDFLNGRSSIQALFESLQQWRFVYAVQTDSTGSITALFFAHPKAVELCNQFSSVFIMDCTYKTNQFEMPLLNIVGITSTFKTFNAGFVFLSEEKIASYVWALEQFKTIFQEALLCVFVTDLKKL
jgi:hypothetical protein